jgi:predicted transcriptional regulator
MRIVLLPVKPKFAQAIMDGRKSVEYRKTPFPSHVTNVVVYASSPTQMILGHFGVRAVVSDSPDRIWRRYREFGCIPRREYAAYYNGAGRAVALLIGTVCVLPRPLPLSSLGTGQRAPQSFAYLSATDFEAIRSHDLPALRAGEHVHWCSDDADRIPSDHLTRPPASSRIGPWPTQGRP